MDKLIEKDRVSIIAGVTFSHVMMAIYNKVVGAEVFLVGSHVEQPRDLFPVDVGRTA